MGAASDFNPDQARASRSDLVERFADTGTLVVGTHFADPVAGHIRRDGARFRLISADESYRVTRRVDRAGRPGQIPVAGIHLAATWRMLRVRIRWETSGARVSVDGGCAAMRPGPNDAVFGRRALGCARCRSTVPTSWRAIFRMSSVSSSGGGRRSLPASGRLRGHGSSHSPDLGASARLASRCGSDWTSGALL